MESITLAQPKYKKLDEMQLLLHEIIEDKMALWDALFDAQFTLEQFDCRMESLRKEQSTLESQITQLQQELNG